MSDFNFVFYAGSSFAIYRKWGHAKHQLERFIDLSDDYCFPC